MSNIFLVEERPEIADNRADLLRSFGNEVSVCTDIRNLGQGAGGKVFDSVVYVFNNFTDDHILAMRILRAQHPHSGIYIVSSLPMLREYQREISGAGAVPKSMPYAMERLAKEL